MWALQLLLSTALQLAAVTVSQTLVVFKHKITKSDPGLCEKQVSEAYSPKAHTGAQELIFEVKKKINKTTKSRKAGLQAPHPHPGLLELLDIK